MQELRTELAATLDEAQWDWLMPHAKRDAVVMVSQELDLLDVGVAIASDNANSVQDWIGKQLIYKPSPEQQSLWNANQEKRFQALIVSPYVLVQEISL